MDGVGSPKCSPHQPQYIRGDMRNPNRIPRILSQIKAIWEKNPDLRLCQLLGNCFVAGDNYYKEDDILEKKLDEVYKEGKDAQAQSRL